MANTGWDRWTPVNAGAIAAHLVGSTGLLLGNKGRVLGQRGVASAALAKTALTGAALGVTAYSRMLGTPRVRATRRCRPSPAPSRRPARRRDVAEAQRKLSCCSGRCPP